MAGSTNVGSIHYDLTLDTDKFDRATNNVNSKLGAFGGRMASLAKVGAIAGVALAGVGTALSTKAYSEAEQAIAQTEAVLKSTKGVAGVTADEITRLSTAYQKVTTFSDEAIRSGQNILLTFTNIGKDIFPQATETILNMSTALGQDLQSSAIQLGKALQDPVEGVTALRRVGVNFNDTQQETIKNLVASGQAMEAQKLILAELATEFGGSATAKAKTFGGQVEILKNNVNDFMESIGKGVTDKLTPMLKGLNDWIDKNGGVEASVGVVRAKILELWDSLYTKIQPAIYQLKAVWAELQPSFIALANTVKTELLPSLQRLWDAVSPILIPALKILGVIIGATLITAIYLITNALNIWINIITGVYNAIASAINWLLSFNRTITNLAVDIVFAIVNAFNQVIGWIKTLLTWFGALHLGAVNKFNELINWARGIPSALKNAVGNLWGILWDAGWHAMNSLWDGLKKRWNDVAGWIGSVGSKIKNLKGPLDKDKVMLVNEGQAIMQGLNTGIIQGFNDVRKTLLGVNYGIANFNRQPQQNVNTSIYGNISIGSEVDANNFLSMLSRNQELALKSIATRPGAI